jgi:D-tyrosyl-tRNA(Tyr) deacylase
VTVDGAVTGRLDRGLLVYVGVEQGDGVADRDYIVNKVAGMRVFQDDAGRMNVSLADLDAHPGGPVGILAISQFTLHGDMRKGRRPSYNAAEEPARARTAYEEVVARWRGLGLHVETGVFGAHMDVSYTNDGPVTILLDSRRIL